MSGIDDPRWWLYAEDIDMGLRCCVCRGEFADDETRYAAITIEGPYTKQRHWHPACGPIDMKVPR
jgi:hypothetical protein